MLHLHGGLIGCESWDTFEVAPSPHDPNMLHLTWVNDDRVALSIYRAVALVPDYSVTPHDEDEEKVVLLPKPSHAWLVLSRYELPQPHLTANLRAPLLIGEDFAQGAQVLQASNLPIRMVVAGKGVL